MDETLGQPNRWSQVVHQCSGRQEGDVVSTRLIELGRQVDGQICQAIDALSHFDAKGARQILAAEAEVNALEVEIDRDITRIIAKR